MTAVLVPNTTDAEEPPPVPVRPEGGNYRFRMLYDGGWRIAYADTAEELLAVLIPGYDELPAADGMNDPRLTERLMHAVKAQVVLQAQLNATHGLDGLSAEEVAIVTGDRVDPPTPEWWNPELPLVLVDLYYQPYTDVPRPISGIADVEHPPNISYLRPDDPHEYLVSLAEVGFIDVGESDIGI